MMWVCPSGVPRIEVLQTIDRAPPLQVCIASGLDSPQQHLHWWSKEEQTRSHDHSTVLWTGPQQDGGGAYSSTSVMESSPSAELWCWTAQRGQIYKARGC